MKKMYINLILVSIIVIYAGSALAYCCIQPAGHCSSLYLPEEDEFIPLGGGGGSGVNTDDGTCKACGHPIVEHTCDSGGMQCSDASAHSGDCEL